MKKYTPRRASLGWLDSDCPDEVLAIFDDGPRCGHADRFTVFYKTPILRHLDGGHTYANTCLAYRAMSDNPSHPLGVGIYGELSAHGVAAYRRNNRRNAATWSSLPEKVKECVRRDCAPESVP